MKLDKYTHVDSDKALEFQRGEEKAFDHFFLLYYPALCFFAARITADSETAKDIASQAFIKTWRKHEILNTAANIKAYLYQITRNDCYKWLQKQTKEKSFQQNFASLTTSVAENYLPELIHAEVVATLHRYIKQLPAGAQKIFSKLYIEGKSIAETAVELQLSPSTIRTQKMRGLQMLRAIPGIERLAKG